MKILFRVSSIASIIFIAVGMLSFDNFRDFIYLLVMLLAIVAITSGIEHIIRKLR